MRLRTKQERLNYQEQHIEYLKTKYPVGFNVQRIYDIVIIRYNCNICGIERPCVKIYKAAAAHPFENHYFRTFEARDAFTENAILSAQIRTEYKTDRQAKRKAFRHSLQVGNILYDSWGYDQTNVDYFQVIDVDEFYVTVREIACRNVPGSDGFMSEQVSPAPDHFIGPPMRKKVCEGNCIKTKTWGSWANLCSENAKHYHSWYA